MFRASPLIVTAFTAAAPLVADDGSVCANCWDGPEMFEHRRGATDLVPYEVLSIEDIGRFPDSARISCGDRAIVSTFGGVEWQVTECADGMLRFTAANESPAIGFDVDRDPGGALDLADDPPEKEPAKSAYLELRELTKQQLEKLVREVRKHH
jgi:hypothetical protein